MLRLGHAGDCWFLSALAVLAERPDLLQVVLPGVAAAAAAAADGGGRNGRGAHLVRMFLDGEWQATVVDAFLPCLPEQRAATGGGGGGGGRRQRRPAGNPERLAFSRAAGRHIWAPVLEKAYAKAHGCYHAISGGQVAEALVELSGDPAEAIEFDDQGGFGARRWRRPSTRWPPCCAAHSAPAACCNRQQPRVVGTATLCLVVLL